MHLWSCQTQNDNFPCWKNPKQDEFKCEILGTSAGSSAGLEIFSNRRSRSKEYIEMLFTYIDDDDDDNNIYLFPI